MNYGDDMKYLHFFNTMLDQIVDSGRALPGVDQDLIEQSREELFIDIDESVCQVCKKALQVKSDQHGDSDYPYYEYEVVCPNNHTQDEGVYVI